MKDTNNPKLNLKGLFSKFEATNKAKIENTKTEKTETKKPKSRHIGGSLLPSSEPRILQPVECKFGILQVRQNTEWDTHGLFLKHETGESLIATHPNGYSCHVLLECMKTNNVRKIREQVNYILVCGGTASSLEYILNAIKG